MRNTNKKGFTIVELVIVVAVIAILAAVLIPTFSSIIKKANIASDTAVAKNLNTAAISAGAKDFDSAIEAVKDAGYLLANLNAKANGCYFVWDDANDQFLLVDTTDSYKVIYSNTDASEKSNWYVAVSDPTKFAEIESAGLKVEKMITDVAGLKAALTTGGEFHIDESLVIEEQIKYTGTTPLVLNLNGSNLATSEKLNNAPVMVDGSVKIINAIITAAGSDESEYGRFNVSIGYTGRAELEIDNVTFSCQTGINGTFMSDGFVNMIVKNSTFDVTNSGVILSTGEGTGSTATVENCTINAGEYAIFASQGGTITVNGGSYKGGTAVISTMYAGTKVIVNGGTFEGALSVTNNGTLVINGGTFKNTGLELNTFKTYLAEGKTVTENADGSWTVK